MHSQLIHGNLAAEREANEDPCPLPHGVVSKGDNFSFQTLQSPKANPILIPKPPLILHKLEGGNGRIGGKTGSECLVPLNQHWGVGKGWL